MSQSPPEHEWRGRNVHVHESARIVRSILERYRGWRRIDSGRMYRDGRGAGSADARYRRSILVRDGVPRSVAFMSPRHLLKPKKPALRSNVLEVARTSMTADLTPFEFELRFTPPVPCEAGRREDIHESMSAGASGCESTITRRRATMTHAPRVVPSRATHPTGATFACSSPRRFNRARAARGKHRLRGHCPRQRGRCSNRSRCRFRRFSAMRTRTASWRPDLGDVPCRRICGAARPASMALWDAVALIALLQRRGAELSQIGYPAVSDRIRRREADLGARLRSSFRRELPGRRCYLRPSAARSPRNGGHCRGLALGAARAVSPRLSQPEPHVHDGTLHVIDFQDARMGPDTTIRASLLRTPSVDRPTESWTSHRLFPRAQGSLTGARSVAASISWRCSGT